MITVVGLGPSTCSYISVGAYGAIRTAPTVFVRTEHHPAVTELAAEGIAFKSLDYIYESSGTFGEVYARIAELILDEDERGDIVYAVPGHPLVGEEAVKILIREARNKGREIKIIGSESFIESSLEALQLSMDAGLKVLDALSMDRVAPATDVGNLIYQVYDRDIASDVKLKLMELYPDEYDVDVIFGGAPPGEQVQRIPLYKLDRCDCDHLTSVYIPRL